VRDRDRDAVLVGERPRQSARLLEKLLDADGLGVVPVVLVPADGAAGGEGEEVLTKRVSSSYASRARISCCSTCICPT
jgi:hypothetical protein